MGKKVSGATRWIDFYFFTFQPAEFTKIFVLLALAKYFHSIKLQSHDIKQKIFFPLFILLIPVFLIFRQPDLGTALVIFFSGVIVLFLSGVNFRTFIKLSPFLPKLSGRGKIYKIRFNNKTINLIDEILFHNSYIMINQFD